MILASAAVLVLLALGGALQPSPTPGAEERAGLRQDQIMIRARAIRPRIRPDGPMVEWRESRGPRCVAARQVIGATALRQNSVDLILRDNSRVRARLQRRCPALDYYRGFYIHATPDGRVCADRDTVRARSGGECQIESFRRLTPHRP